MGSSLGYSPMDSRRRRKRREQLWNEDPHCFWCGKRTVLTTERRRDATLDHLYSRLHPNRLSNGVTHTVLACRACNIQRADYETKGAYFMPRLKERIEIARQACAVTRRLKL